MDGASRAGDDIGAAAGDDNVLGAVDGLLVDGGRGDGRRWRGGTGGRLDLAVVDLAHWLHRTQDGAGAEGGEDE